MANQAFYSALARSILAGEAAENATAARMALTLGKRWRWLKPLARRYLAVFGAPAPPRRREVVAFLKADRGLRRAAYKYRGEIRIAQWIQEPQGMRPAIGARAWPIPAIATVGDLAEWLKARTNELEWFADLRRFGARAGDAKTESPISHYHYRILSKGYGSIRLIESPKRKLKKLQRKILDEILEKIPLHEAAHGFCPGRSIRSFAEPHVGKRVVLRMDLTDFFPSISGARVRAFFHTAGYPEAVADRLGGICTNAAPGALWRALGKELDPQRIAEARRLYASPHLPQGAPSSPALANLCFFRADCRLSGLAKAAGATYTRYADDLAFSGDEYFERSVDRFATRVAAIVLEERYRVHHRKTRVMRQGVRQYLAGIVVNERVNVVRPDFDELEAILTNCVRRGPESQNREKHPAFRSHLDGRVGFVESINPTKGARLRRIFERIEWS
jgi:RNA-directed DNA polymerase